LNFVNKIELIYTPNIIKRAIIKEKKMRDCGTRVRSQSAWCTYEHL